MNELAKSLAKALLPTRIQTRLRAFFALPLRLARLERQVGVLAASQARCVYGASQSAPVSRSAINQHELQVYSQHGEDGILQFIFSQIGPGTKTFVEFGMGDGRECNTAFLTLHHGWRGLLMDGNAERVAAACAFYERNLGEGQRGVAIVDTWITTENINGLIDAHGPGAELDLLSIDMDGMDYWIWKAISSVRPRVVVIEYSAVLGWERATTVPYAPDFSRWRAHPSGLYAGASLRALEDLGREKGYRLVGCNRQGINAFFIRDDIAAEALPAVPAANAYYPGDDLVLGLITPDRIAEIAHLDFVDVGSRP